MTRKTKQNVVFFTLIVIALLLANIFLFDRIGLFLELLVVFVIGTICIAAAKLLVPDNKD